MLILSIIVCLLYGISRKIFSRQFSGALKPVNFYNGIVSSVLSPGAVKTDMLGVSTRALDDFCDNSKLYSCNAKRFKGIVNSVEAKNVSPDKIAKVTLKAVNAKRPRFVYKINRNKLLLLLNILPQKLQTKIIKKILN